MPVIFEKSLKRNCRIAIWQITESLKELEDGLDLICDYETQLSAFKSDARKLEWICTRVLVKYLIPEIKEVNIIYDENGKPHLEPGRHSVDYHISISHTRKHVAVIISKDFQAGIDIETINSRIIIISKRFIGEDELENIGVNAVEHMHVLWGAKEVIYKLYSRGEVSFKNEIVIERFSYEGKGALRGYLLKDNFAKSYSLHYEKINELMLVYGNSIE